MDSNEEAVRLQSRLGLYQHPEPGGGFCWKPELYKTISHLEKLDIPCPLAW